MSETILSLSNYSLLRAKHCLLTNANLTIYAGEQIYLTGVSGCGKTSLCESLVGRLYASGDMQINWRDEVEFDKKISLVSQFSSFVDKTGQSEFYYQQRFNSHDSDNTVTVAENLSLNNYIADARLTRLIQIFNFEKKLSASLLHLSSGERKKLQLIKSLYLPSQIVILDNPFIGLDKVTLLHLNAYLAKLADAGVTFIIVANYLQIPKFISHVVMITADKQLTKAPLAEYIPDYTTTGDSLEKSQIMHLLPPLAVEYNDIVLLHDIKVAYGDKKIIDGINWQVKAGEKWLLSGENGAGKSTVLSLINGDHPQAYANDIVLFDKKRGSGETIWELKRKIGYVSPELHWNFDRSMTCLQAVLSGFFDTPGLYGKATLEQITTVLQWLEILGMSDIAEQKFANVSNGAQRSLLFLRALVKNPPLFIFDEPCQGLDKLQSQKFIDLIDMIFADSQHTIIYVSHLADEVPNCINRKLHLNSIENQNTKSMLS